MPEVANITGHITSLRDKGRNSVFGENNKKPKITKENKTERPMRSSVFSFLAIGVVIALFAIQIIAASMFTVIGS